MISYHGTIQENRLGVDLMFKHKSEPKQELLGIEVSQVVLKDSSSFNAVESVSEIAKRIDLKNDFIYIHEFISTKQIKPKLVRVSLINFVENSHVCLVCKDPYQKIDEYNETVKRYGAKRAGVYDLTE